MIKNPVFKNATWIIACKIIQAVLGLVVTMFSTRYLGPSGYGLINYAAAVVAFVLPVMQLGFSNTIVQELVNHPQEEGKTMGSAITLNLVASVFCIAGVVSFTAIANPGEKDTLIVCALYSTMLISQAVEMIQYWFQAKLLSKYTAIISLISYIVVSAYKLILLITGVSVYWFAISHAIDYILIAIALLCVYNKLGNGRLSFSWSVAKRMFAKSKFYIISSLMVTIFAQTDKIMIKMMMDEAAVGYYSTAVTCASMMAFVFAAIIDSARPPILESLKRNEAEFERGITRLYSVIIYLSLLQCIAFVIFAKLIIRIIGGAEYVAYSVSALQIIVWYTTFAYLGAVRNVWVLGKAKHKYLWILNLSGALLNIVLNYFFIPMWGINGAAWASLITQIFVNFIMNFIVYPYARNNILMFKSLNPKYILEMLKKPAAVTETQTKSGVTTNMSPDTTAIAPDENGTDAAEGDETMQDKGE